MGGASSQAQGWLQLINALKPFSALTIFLMILSHDKSYKFFSWDQHLPVICQNDQHKGKEERHPLYVL